MLKDLFNKLYWYRGLNSELGDAEAAMNWFRTKGREEPQFFCRYTRDKEGRLANLFWRDHASFLDYEAFGDVLVVDSTYKTNIYGMPLVLFVGQNNHRASVVFACALVSDEKEDTFSWLIEKFLCSMKGLVPKTVVTDGCESMRKAFETHMPNARHQLCAWHIGRNVGQNVKAPEVANLLGNLIYASYSVEEWEVRWEEMVTKYGLQDNSWMNQLYLKRMKWAETFFRGHYCGGMCSTQRCEGMNNKVKTSVGGFTKLIQFVPRIYQGICRLRDRVSLNNFKSQNHIRKFETALKILEEEIFSIFTDDIYLVIKGQIIFESNFIVSSRVDCWDNLMCYVTQYGVPNKCWSVTRIAGSTDTEGDTFSCSCQLFESDGIPCCHIFCVLKREGVVKFPKSLIWNRWRKDVLKETVIPKVSIAKEDRESVACRYAGLIGVAKRLCHNMSLTVEGSENGGCDLNKLLEKYTGEMLLKNKTTYLGDSDNVVRDPVLARTKGMHGNIIEGGKPVEANKCGNCGTPGHNKRSCPFLPKASIVEDAATRTGAAHLSQVPGHRHRGGQSEHDVEEANINVQYSNGPAMQPHTQPAARSHFDFGVRGNENAVPPDLNHGVDALGEDLLGRAYWGSV